MLKNLINLLYPKLCNGCNSLLLKNEYTICSACIHDLPYTNHHKLEDNDTTKKFYGIIPIEFGGSLFYFHQKGIVQNLVHNLKYRNKQEIGTYLGKLHANELKVLTESKKFTEIIPVPLHPKRLKERGYNQITTYGMALSTELNIPYNPTLLFRNRYSKTQTKKDREKRKEVSNSLFDVTFSEKDHNQHFLLIDDVITSGATLEACAKALLKIPNSKVSIVTIAYTLS
ncbi:ComF family protein [Flavobacterium cyclinae]|uniref:ComF family protein n=1 Tax=Flavobacterium cyclinae TaxID=2895947 RepID=UPI001E504165|nr:ComF family protein [Flavobacterium cyclinae]UGS20942.1 ComF family protein [Flavobacterium cyclinae]